MEQLFHEAEDCRSKLSASFVLGLIDGHEHLQKERKKRMGQHYASLWSGSSRALADNVAVRIGAWTDGALECGVIDGD